MNKLTSVSAILRSEVKGQVELEANQHRNKNMTIIELEKALLKAELAWQAASEISGYIYAQYRSEYLQLGDGGPGPAQEIGNAQEKTDKAYEAYTDLMAEHEERTDPHNQGTA